MMKVDDDVCDYYIMLEELQCKFIDYQREQQLKEIQAKNDLLS